MSTSEPPANQTANQTLSFLIRRFKEAGIRPHTKFGQNFLIDLNLLRVLADAAELSPDDVVLEVGTGTGSLTTLMAARAAAVVTVEIDPQMYQLASEELIAFDNVVQLHADALKNKNCFNPDVLAVVDKALAAEASRRWKLVANLPYNVATPILTNLLALDRSPTTMVVTIQNELADRIVAVPRTKDYGALSIWMQSQCDVEIVRRMPPEVFWPRPKVTSAILRITLNETKRARIADRAYFHQFVRSMFFHRRKFLRSELLSAYKKRFEKPQVDAILEAMQFKGTVRAEELSVEDMMKLCQLCQTEAGD